MIYISYDLLRYDFNRRVYQIKSFCFPFEPVLTSVLIFKHMLNSDYLLGQCCQTMYYNVCNLTHWRKYKTNCRKAWNVSKSEKSSQWSISTCHFTEQWQWQEGWMLLIKLQQRNKSDPFLQAQNVQIVPKAIASYGCFSVNHALWWWRPFHLATVLISPEAQSQYSFCNSR